VSLRTVGPLGVIPSLAALAAGATEGSDSVVQESAVTVLSGWRFAI